MAADGGNEVKTRSKGKGGAARLTRKEATSKSERLLRALERHRIPLGLLAVSVGDDVDRGRGEILVADGDVVKDALKAAKEEEKRGQFRS